MVDTTHSHIDEVRRLQALKDYAILDSEVDADFDDFTALAANYFSAPVALIGLVDAHRQWYKSKVGITAEEVPRMVSFCDWAIRDTGVMVVEDASKDPRFSANPFVAGDAHVRFYAGAPLVTSEGHALGTLCVIDREPRSFTEEQKSTLAVLARKVMGQLELRRKNSKLKSALNELSAHESLLEESRSRLAFAMEASGVGDWTLDLRSNRATRSLQHDHCFGYAEPIDNWSYDTFLAHVDSRDRDRVDGVFKTALGGEGIYDVEYRVTWPDGSEHWLWSKGQCFFDHAHVPNRVGGIVSDVTHRKLAEAKFEQSQERYRLLFEHSMGAVLQLRLDGSILEANPAACQLFGMSETALRKSSRTELVDTADNRYAFYLDSSANASHSTRVLRMRRADGTNFEAEVGSSLYVDNQGIQSESMMIRDVTQQVTARNDLEAANVALAKYNEQLKSIAHYDSLTGLPNRVLLADRLQQAIILSRRSNTGVGVAFLDIDGFKAVNDEHGHSLGDELLVALSKRMHSALRDSDTLSRISGDEFVAIIGGLEREDDIVPTLSRLLDAVALPVIAGTNVCSVTVSIGATIYPRDFSDADHLIRHADQAMYVAKQEGKNRYHLFDAERDAKVSHQRENIAEISRALQDHQFVLFYQPKVNLRTGVIIGMEALIRWKHPTRGLLLPDSILPLIEQHPIAVSLGEWVISTALAQIAKWGENGLRMPVSVNVSALQLQQVNFVERLRNILSAHSSVLPNMLELEILESSAVQDLAQVALVMKACNEFGAQFALDDFGTGYSSLTYLKSLPAQLIKIDKSFVRDMLFDQSDLAIIRGVIGLANAFERNVLAEGVETAEHGAKLLEMGCDLVQGYGIARPMEADSVIGWSLRWQQSPKIQS